VEIVGDAEADERAYARAKLLRVIQACAHPPTTVRIELSRAHDGERGAVAKARVEVAGHVVRTHVAATTIRAAIDIVETRLRQRLARLQRLTERADHPGIDPRHRPAYTITPRAARSIVRRKSWAPTPMRLNDAIREAELRDYDFFLFRDAETGRDGVACRLMGTDSIVIDPARSDQVRRCSVGDAVERANAVNACFVLFVEPRTRGLHALYRRFDGNYGLIAPAG
jgi:ribosome-associated translation inhibitor RaiA